MKMPLRAGKKNKMDKIEVIPEAENSNLEIDSKGISVQSSALRS